MEFRISTKWRFFGYFASLLFGVLGLYLLSALFAQDTASLLDKSLIFSFSFGICLFAFYFFLRIHREKLIISNDKLVLQLAFTKRWLRFNEVKGFTVDSNYIRIFPIDESKKALNVSIYMGNKVQLFISLARFTNLDTESKKEQELEIRENENYGANYFERNERLTFAVKNTKWVNGISIVMAIWAWFYPKPYDLVVIINMLIPILAISIFIYFKGLILLDRTEKNIRPTIFSALVLPTTALAIRCLFDYNFLHFSNTWLISLFIATPLFLLLLSFSDELRSTKLNSVITSFLIFGLLFAHTFSSILILNVMLDPSQKSIYKAEVLSKHSSKHFESIRLKSESINKLDREVKIKISSSLYDRAEKGDSAIVVLRNGFFGAPWLQVNSIISSEIKTQPFQFQEDTTLFRLK